MPTSVTQLNVAKTKLSGLLIVTPEGVAKKISNTNENKSPGVDGIPPKILKEYVEQISMSFAHVLILTCHYRREELLYNGNKQMSFLYFKKVQESSL